MYIGNLSDFFYKNKTWLSTQPKFYVESNKANTILKIGGKYYNFDSVTGKLELIKTNDDKKKNSLVLNTNNNSISQENKKENNFPAIFERIEKKRKSKIQNTEYNNSIFNPFLSNGSYDFESTNKSNDNIKKGDNKFFCLDKKEQTSSVDNRSKKKKTMKMNYTNTYTNTYNDNGNFKINKSINNSMNNKRQSFQLYTENKINNNNFIKKIKNLSIGNKKKYHHIYNKSYDNKIKTNKKLLSKRNIKKLIEKRKKENDELKTNNTYVSNNTNNTNNNNINNDKSSISNINNISLYNNKAMLKRKLPPFFVGPKEFANRFFPNSESLKIKKEDSWFLKTIKNQLFRDRIFDDLKNQFHFYQDSENKRQFFKIPKINIKNSIILSKKDIFPAKESVHHKIFFDYVHKHKKGDIKDDFIIND